VDEAIDALAANTLLEIDPGAAAMAWAGLARARWRAGDLPGVSLGDRAEMANALPEARRWAETLDDGGALPRLRWFEGHCHAKERERRFREARDAFAAAGEDWWAVPRRFEARGSKSDEGAINPNGVSSRSPGQAQRRPGLWRHHNPNPNGVV
jgi:hypothetical protein